MAIRVIQFSHPGLQLDVEPGRRNERYSFYENDDKCGLRTWNYDSGHFRKFLRADGYYMKSMDESPTKGELLFWGEWEPYSEFKHLRVGKNVQEPEAIHAPIRYNEKDMEKFDVNTDPFMWSKLYYSTCKQRTFSFLRDLEEGSVLVLGTEYGEEFAIDTIYVVGSEQYFMKDLLADPDVQLVDWYVDQSYSRIDKSYTAEYADPDTRDSRLRALDEIKTYEGRAHRSSDPTKKYLFSYTPAKLYSEHPMGFERMKVKSVDWGFQNPGAGTVTWRVKDETGERIETFDGAKKFWESITEECLRQGFYLGTRLMSNIPKLSTLPTERLFQWD